MNAATRSLWFRLRAWWIIRGYGDRLGRRRTREWTPEEHAAFFQRLMAEGRRRGLLAPGSPTCDQPKRPAIGTSTNGVIYTTQGAMTATDLEEHRRDTDWYELHRREPAEDECAHLRLLTDDCDDCPEYQPECWCDCDPCVCPGEPAAWGDDAP